MTEMVVAKKEQKKMHQWLLRKLNFFMVNKEARLFPMADKEFANSNIQYQLCFI
jgi:hypothetical protein